MESALEVAIRHRRGRKYAPARTALSIMIDILTLVKAYPMSRSVITRKANLYPYQFSLHAGFLLDKGLLARHPDEDLYGITVRGRLFLELLE